MSELKARHIVDVYDSYYAENPFGERSQVYLKSEADKVIADLEESHKMEVEQLLMEIVKLKSDYKEACDRLQTANLIKDEQIAAARHQKYKRCLAMASYWLAVSYQCVDNKHKRNAERHRRKWLEFANKFKDKETK